MKASGIEPFGTGGDTHTHTHARGILFPSALAPVQSLSYTMHTSGGWSFFCSSRVSTQSFSSVKVAAAFILLSIGLKHASNTLSQWASLLQPLPHKHLLRYCFNRTSCMLPGWGWEGWARCQTKTFHRKHSITVQA